MTKQEYNRAYYLKHKAAHNKQSAANYALSSGRLAAKARLWRIDNPEAAKKAARKGHLKRTYGMTEDEFEVMLKKQRHRCAICRTKEPGGRGVFHIDHCHKTGKVRSLLCIRCNLILGKACDSVKLFNECIKYLGTHKK